MSLTRNAKPRSHPPNAPHLTRAAPRVWRAAGEGRTLDASAPLDHDTLHTLHTLHASLHHTLTPHAHGDDDTHNATARAIVLGVLLFDPDLPPPAPLRGPLWQAWAGWTRTAPAALVQRAHDTLHDTAPGWSLRTRRDAAALAYQALAWHTPRAQTPETRRTQGVFYTPTAPAAWLAAHTLAPLADPDDDAPPLRVWDPCCGTGILLCAALDALHDAGRRPCAVYGGDIDPGAVEIARLRVWTRLPDAARDLAAATQLADQLTVRDGLTPPPVVPDVGLTNPPFGSAVTQDTKRSADTQQRHRALYPDVARGAYDRAFIFAAHVAHHLRPGGRCGLVLPRSVMSLASADGLRTTLERIAPPAEVWSPDTSALFESAQIYVTFLIGTRAPVAPPLVRVSTAPPRPDGRGPSDALTPIPRRPEAGWGAWIAPERALCARVWDAPAPRVALDRVATLHSGAATGAAYALRDHVRDAPEGDGLRLITTGLIDRYCTRWGEQPCRFLKRRFAHPRWPSSGDDAPRSVATAAARQARPKVLVAGLSRVLEATADPRGALGGVVSTWVVRPKRGGDDGIWWLEALLNAPMLSLLYMTRFCGKQLNSGNTTVGQRELRTLQVPAALGGELAARALTTPLGAGDALDTRALFDLDPLAPQDQARLIRCAASAVMRPSPRPLDAPSPAQQHRAAAAIARLYGLDRACFEALLDWERARLGAR